MVIYKVIRPKKKISENVVEINSREKRVTTREKILKTLTSYKKGLTLTDLAFKADIKSCGNTSQIVKFLVRSKELIKETCPHCKGTTLYKLNI